MEFTCTTVYDHKALTAMNRAMRKTVRKKQSHRSRISGIIVMFLALVMLISGIAETEEYFVFAIDTHYGQVYAKSGLTGGTSQQFAAFLTERTGLPVRKV